MISVRGSGSEGRERDEGKVENLVGELALAALVGSTREKCYGDWRTWAETRVRRELSLWLLEKEGGGV